MVRVSGKQDFEGQLVKLGQAIRVMRKAKGMTQETLADAAGVERAHLGKVERGERNVTFLNVLRIAAALGETPSALLGEAGL